MRLQILGAGHGEERTANIQLMSVTLEVSKLSGWSNADAYCRESKEGHRVCGARYAGRQAEEAAGDRGASSVQERARLHGLGARHGEERTSNIQLISVTLEVSKLSGWLNADASCRESKGGTRCGVRYTGRQAGGGGRPRCKQRVGQGSTAHMGHGKGTVNMKLVVVKGVRRTQRAGGGSDRGG